MAANWNNDYTFYDQGGNQHFYMAWGASGRYLLTSSLGWGLVNYGDAATDDNDINVEGNYSDFELIENVAIPFKIEIMNKVKNQKIKISYKDILTNEKGLKVKFELPGDAEIIEW